MNDAVRAALDQIEALSDRGRRLIESRSVDAVRIWQQDCAALVNQLSGGSKAHWLSRAFSQAFLVRPTDGGLVVEASSSEIVERLLHVLSQARASVSQITDAAAAATAAPRATRFDFVHNAELRPVLERALTDGRAALDAGESQRALKLLASVLEAIITDALEHHSLSPQPPALSDPPVRSLQTLSFDERIAEAEKAGLIRAGCARLPSAARQYRGSGSHPPATSHQPPATVEATARDARVTGQVLSIVMRDLDPGR